MKYLRCLAMVITLLLFIQIDGISKNKKKDTTLKIEHRLNFEVGLFPSEGIEPSLGPNLGSWGGFGGWRTGNFEQPYSIDYHDHKDFTNFGLNYEMVVRERLSIKYGFRFALLKNKISTDDETWGSRVNKLYAIHKDVGYTYIKRRSFEMYAAVGIAGIYVHKQNNLNSNDSEMPEIPKDIGEDYMLNFQLSPICIRVGNDVAFIAELGYGHKGIINVGLSKNLN